MPRTSTATVNVATLQELFHAGAEVTPESLVEKGVLKNTRTDVKILGNGDLKKKLAVTVHAVSATAREKIEAAGGSITLLQEPKERKPKRRLERPAPSEPAAAVEPGPEAEAEPEEAGPEAAERAAEEEES